MNTKDLFSVMDDTWTDARLTNVMDMFTIDDMYNVDIGCFQLRMGYRGASWIGDLYED